MSEVRCPFCGSENLECGTGDTRAGVYRTHDCWSRQLDQQRARADQAEAQAGVIRDAANWLAHVLSGVGKAGGPPETGEFEDAFEAVKTVLSSGAKRDPLPSVDPDSDDRLTDLLEWGTALVKYANITPEESDELLRVVRRLTHDPEWVKRLEREQETLRDALRRPFLTVFLDGRNEHGSHVLTMPGDSIGDTEEIEKDLDDQDEGLAERIISEAEALGHAEGHCVVTRWEQGEYEETWGWEYVGVDPLLTDVLCGTPEEQRAELDREHPAVAAYLDLKEPGKRSLRELGF